MQLDDNLTFLTAACSVIKFRLSADVLQTNRLLRSEMFGATHV